MISFEIKTTFAPLGLQPVTASKVIGHRPILAFTFTKYLNMNCLFAFYAYRITKRRRIDDEDSNLQFPASDDAIANADAPRSTAEASPNPRYSITSFPSSASHEYYRRRISSQYSILSHAHDEKFLFKIWPLHFGRC